jgi:predicted DNA-binding transcriptional regulator AlpA
MDATEFVTIPELAQRVHMSAEHLYRLARIGKLPGAIQLGRRYVVNWEAFVAFSNPPMTPSSARSASSSP